MKRTLSFAAALAIGTAALMPLSASAQIDVNLVINSAPPAARYESIPAPRSGYVWAPGYWNWEGNRHVWLAGHWETERRGYQYQRSEWVRDNDSWRLDRGGWQQVSDNDGYVRMAPPPPRYEPMPHGRPGYIWVPGYWEWRGNRHEWIQGNWMQERSGYVYSRPTWRETNGRWVFEQGRWDRGYGDRDRDGIPDRYDRHNDNQRYYGNDRNHNGIRDRMERPDRDRDGVADKYDRDRDGDGVPNRNDRRPDNPRRY